VELLVSGTFLGDIRATLTHGGKTAVLLNRVGRRNGALSGYGDDGCNVTIDDEAGNGDIHIYRLTLKGDEAMPLGGPVVGFWASDGRSAAGGAVLDTSPRDADLSVFDGLNGAGGWTLNIADLSGGNEHFLVRWLVRCQFTNELTKDNTESTLYAASDCGVFYLKNPENRTGPYKWLQATQSLGLPNVQVNALSYTGRSGLLSAGTYGRGVWRLPVGKSMIRSLGVFPNPPTRNTTAQGLVTLTRVASANTTVQLGSSADVTVPATVVVPAGQVNATFNVVLANTNRTPRWISAMVNGVSVVYSTFNVN
jgi:hypothetical protein